MAQSTPTVFERRSYVASRVTADAGAPTGTTIVANTRKALFQLHHANTATTTKRIRRVVVAALAGAAVQYGYEVYRVTAAPTGGTAVTPIAADAGDAASTLTCTYLPTAAGATTGVPLAGTTVLGAATGHAGLVLYDSKVDGKLKPLVVRAGFTEGFCVFVRGTGVAGPDPQLFVEWTEE